MSMDTPVVESSNNASSVAVDPLPRRSRRRNAAETAAAEPTNSAGDERQDSSNDGEKKKLTRRERIAAAVDEETRAKLDGLSLPELLELEEIERKKLQGISEEVRTLRAKIDAVENPNNTALADNYGDVQLDILNVNDELLRVREEIGKYAELRMETADERREIMSILREFTSQIKMIRQKIDEDNKEFDIIKNKIAAEERTQKEMRAKYQYFEMDKIEAEIERINNQIQTHTMPLSEEKKLVEQVKTLERSKTLIGDYTAIKERLDALYATRKAIQSKIRDKRDLLRPLIEKEREQRELLNEFNERVAKSVPKELLEEKERLMGQMNGLRDRRTAEREKKREATKEYYDTIRDDRKALAKKYEERDRCEGLLAALSTRKSDVTERKTLTIPVDSISAVVGRSGATIRGVEKKYTCEIHIDRKSGSVTVQGAKENLEEATAEIERLSTNAASSPTGSVSTVRLPRDLVGRFVGRRGDKVKKLSEETGAQFDIVRQNETVKVKGTAEQVKKGVAAVEKFLADAASGDGERNGERENEREAGVEKQSIPVDEDSVGRVIGRGGSTIKRIEQESGCRVSVDRKKSQIDLVGTLEAIAAASNLIDSILGYAE